ncbi:unnamed protein product [Alternaria alternata]
MDPFSISLGVLPLIHLAGKTAIELKKLQNGAAKAKDNINAMLADLRSLETVLTTIKVELEDLDSRAPLTGKIGEHWVSLKTILDDVCDPLKKLEALLVSTNKDVRWLSSTRRAIRLKDANDQIGIYRQSIQTYQDTLQLSLHTGVADNPPASQHTSTPGSPMTLSPAYSKAQQEITSDDSLAQPPLESSTIHKAETGEPGDMVIQESLPREDQTMVHKNKPPRAVCSKVKRIWTFVGDGRCGKTCFIK